MTSPADILTNLADPSKWPTMIAALMKNLGEAPKEFMACTSVGVDLGLFIAWLVKHITIQTVTTSLATNALAHVMGLITDAGSILSSLMSFDFYTLGFDIGEILWLLFD